MYNTRVSDKVCNQTDFFKLNEPRGNMEVLYTDNSTNDSECTPQTLVVRYVPQHLDVYNKWTIGGTLGIGGPSLNQYDGLSRGDDRSLIFFPRWQGAGGRFCALGALRRDRAINKCGGRKPVPLAARSG